MQYHKTLIISLTLLLSLVASSNQCIKCGFEFDGDYLDPNHPGCKRTISAQSTTEIKVTGFDGKDGGACNGTDDVAWGPLDGKVTAETIVIDFSPKGGPSDLTGTLNSDEKRITWADGNYWPMYRANLKFLEKSN